MSESATAQAPPAMEEHADSPAEPQPLVNGDVKKTPVVSINSVGPEREGATSPRSTLVSIVEGDVNARVYTLASQENSSLLFGTFSRGVMARNYTCA